MPRRLAAVIVAAAATLAATGCTATGWESSAPSGDGVNVDSGSYRARNILVVADEEGTGLVLGSLFSSAKEASLEGAEITPHPFDGSEAAAAEVTEAEGEIPTPGGLKLAGVAADANLEAGTTATVTFTFADGATLEVEAPVYSSESASYAQDFTEAVG